MDDYYQRLHHLEHFIDDDRAVPGDPRVWNFGGVLPSKPSMFAESNAGTDLRNVRMNVENAARMPPNRVLRLADRHTLADAVKADEPFLVVVHVKGSHALYDRFNVEQDTSPEYFREFAEDDTAMREGYYDGVASAIERFDALVDRLVDRDLPKETLIVFTSDHGELLGEPERGGVYAHGSPICPELVYVPTVFLGAGLPEGRRYDRLLSGTDLAPTLLDARGDEVPAVDGQSAWSSSPPAGRSLRADFWANKGRLGYGGSSAWDAEGGVVRHHGLRRGRAAFGLHRKLIASAQAPANRAGLPRSLPGLVRSFVPREVTYGEPATERLRSALVDEFEPGATESDVRPVSDEQLRALGYVE